MANQFWRMPSEWPHDPPGYVFLARAFGEIGKAKFGDKWSEKENPPKTKLADSQVNEKSQELTDDDDFIPLDVDEQDEAEAEHHRM